MKRWKTECNRKFRRSYGEFDQDGTKYKRLSGDMWDSPSDGKGNWWDDDPKGLRK